VRVGLVIYGGLDTPSGGYLYDRMLVDHLRRRGDQVEVVSLPGQSYLRSLGDNLSGSLRRCLEQGRWDVLLQDELNHPSLFRLNRPLRKKVAYPLISIVHHLRSCELRPAWQNRLYRRLEKLYLDSVDGFIFNSHTTRGEVEKLIGAGKPHIVAYPGRNHLGSSITREQVTKRADSPGPLRIIFLGNLIPRKGLHVLLEALCRLPKDQWLLEIVGSTDADQAYTRAIRRQIAGEDLGPRVRLSGLLTDHQLAGRLAQSQLLAVPSSYEGFGLAYLEAMGFGLPAIASAAGASPEIVSPQQNGFLIHFGDVRGLAQAINKLSCDRHLLLSMSLNALERYADFPTWEQTASQIRRFLHAFSHARTIRRGY
jgi:glycosyltransferase involved in cell wall biosynthesis